MIGLLAKILPYILVLYFLIRFLKEPIYLLGIPFILFFRSAVFADKAAIFRQPGSLDPELKLLGWLFLVWLIIYLKSYFRYESSEQNKIEKRTLNFQDYMIIALLVISSIGLLYALKEYYMIDDVYTQYLTLISLFLGYFMIKDIVRYSKPQVLSDFLFSIIIINSIASFLFLLHQGLHINIFGNSNEYQSFDFQGELITRSFWFSPPLWYFSISYLLVFKRNNSIINFTLLSINILGIFISYNRSSLLTAVLIFIVYFLLTGFKNRDFFNSIKNMILVGILGFVFFLTVSNFLPTSTSYFLSRFNELDEKPANAESNTLLYRFKRTGEVTDKITSEKELFGYGPVTEKQMPFIKTLHIITSDMVWAGVVFRWGFLGLAIFIFLFASSILSAFVLFIKKNGIISQLALLILLTIVSHMIASFTSWAFMADNRFALGLWYFGIFSAIVTANNTQSNFENKAQLNE